MTQSAESQSKSNLSSQDGSISLHQHYYSELEPGIHTFLFEQTITHTQGLLHGKFIPRTCENKYSQSQAVFFGRDRFSLNKELIKSYYPPDREYGNTYRFCLPHIVLLDAALPWEWSAKKDWRDNVKRPVPWLALLVFTLDDINELSGEESILNPVTRSPEQLLKDRPREILCYPTITELYPHENPAKGESTEEKQAKNLQTIDIPAGLFNKIAPTFEDLPYLAHVRQVTANARSMKSSDAGNKGEFYSVLVANRLPRSTKTLVHLVSLIGMEKFLPTADGSNRLGEGKKFVRLVTFANWEFGVNNEARDFENLVCKTLRQENGDPSTLRMPLATSSASSNEERTAREALEMGYIAMKHKTRLGDETVSWYRGPFTPFAVAENLVPKTARSSDSLIRYDKNTGMYDVSYASAWQLGRLLALRNIEVAQSLHDWKVRQNVSDIKGFEQRTIEQALPEEVMTVLHRARSVDGESTPASLGDAVLQALLTQQEQLIQDTPDVASRTVADNHQAEEATGFPYVSANDLRQMLTNESSRSFGGGRGANKRDLPESVKKFLGEISLFQGVPYNYLVPDERMLPYESLRFFHLDHNWCHCLRDGVLSIGRNNSSIRSLDSRNLEYYKTETASISSSYRAKYLNLPQRLRPRDFFDDGAITGCLLHSSVVDDFPGIAVQAFANTDRKKLIPLETLHFEKIGKNIMLFLCKGVLQTIRFSVGAEELHFKVDLPNDTFVKSPLRCVDSSDTSRIKIIEGSSVNIPFRIINGDNKDVISIQSLVSLLASAVDKRKDQFTAADFAFQMISGTPTVDFIATAENRQVTLEGQSTES
ncbi:MAG: hypothetical protein ACK6BG_10835 [Cyanobacteriota bacterium]